MAYASCAIYYNTDILPERLKRAEHEKNAELVNRIKHLSQVAWKQINFYGEYTFRNTGDVINLAQIIDIVCFLSRN